MNREMVMELTRYRGLLGMLAWRDIRVRYKQSVMGVAWAFLMPLIQAAMMYAIFTYGVRGFDKSNTPWGAPYFLFVLSGVVPWSFFAAGVNMSIESLTRNNRLVTKVYFPREVFPLGSVLASLVDFGVAMLMFIPFYLYYWIRGDISPTPLILLLPAVVLIQTLLVGGLALALSMANLFFRDVKYIMTFVIQLWFFATNVMYPINFSNHPHLKWLVEINPMIAILNAYRDALMGSHLTDPLSLCVAAGIAIAVFLGGWRAFHAAEFKFAEYI